MDPVSPHHTRHPVGDVCFDGELIKRYDGRGPRYTSYPTALQFTESFTPEDYHCQAANSNQERRPLSLYVHIPFCQSLCYYCGCNKIVTRNKQRIQSYLQHLYQEIGMQSALFDKDRVVEQLHFGGGTPTYLDDPQLIELMAQLRDHFDLETGDNREFSIEVDPRSVHDDSIRLLAELGFNRLSLGIQDFDPVVQKAVNRIQTVSDVAAIVSDARQYDFQSISFDLIYGLPLQSVASFDRTLNHVIAMRPERLAIYNYAHLPARFKGQRMIRDEDIPAPSTKLEILHHTIDKLVASGYCYIGMDHFALPEDELVKAQKNGTLQRNFQGYSTHSDCDLIALGASAIGNIGNAFAQNATSTPEYEKLISSGQLAIKKGIEIDADDRVRAAVIQELMCHDHLDFNEFGNAHQIDFGTYFATELSRLVPLANDGLIALEADNLRITARGRLLLRSIAMIFDRYLTTTDNDKRFSRAI
ncbi:MAG: oxygen-independent coproporphyrinogen III oxidase [Gammaproteobacteria bacterium]|nr:oxygen-independent coproporphyrinogen III oxidase [Gammaproteobacteria bacterium]